MNKKNLPLVIALVIPFLMIILVAAFIYLPGLGKHPQYNFLYESGNGANYYGGLGQYSGANVQSGLTVFNADKDFYGTNQGKDGINLYFGALPTGTAHVRISRGSTANGPWAVFFNEDCCSNYTSPLLDAVDGTAANYYYKLEAMDSSGSVLKTYAILYMPQIAAEEDVLPEPPQNFSINFYLYNSANNTSEQITSAQAQSYNLNTNNISPDGFTVEQGSNGGPGFPFGSEAVDYNTWYLKGYNRAFKLNLNLNGSYPNFVFLGWIK